MGRMSAEQLWDAEEHNFVTNELHTRYKLILDTRDELMKRWKNGDEALDYPFCLAIINGRVLLMAQQLGNTNEANYSLNQCRLYYKEVQAARHLPITNYSIGEIETLLKRWDGKR